MPFPKVRSSCLQRGSEYAHIFSLSSCIFIHNLNNFIGKRAPGNTYISKGDVPPSA